MARETRVSWSTVTGAPWLYRSRHDDGSDKTAATITAALYGGSDDAGEEAEYAEDAGYDFFFSAEWQAWLDANVPDDVVPCLDIDKRKSTKVELPRRPRGTMRYIAPVSEFTAAEAPRDTFRRLERQLWLAAAQRYGWPEPPGLPPYHDPSLVEDDDADDE